MWNASSGSSAFSGFIELLNNTAGVVKVDELAAYSANTVPLCSVTGATIQEQANRVLAQIDNIINTLDRNIYDRDDIVIFMSQSQFKCYLTALRNVNNFHFTEPTLGQVFETFHPQTKYKVVGVPGLNGSNLIAAGPQQYFLVGVDLMSDEDSFRSWWSMDFQEVRIAVNYKLGVQIAFPQFFVTNGL
jgi:hypothetical protein